MRSTPRTSEVPARLTEPRLTLQAFHREISQFPGLRALKQNMQHVLEISRVKNARMGTLPVVVRQVSPEK